MSTPTPHQIVAGLAFLKLNDIAIFDRDAGNMADTMLGQAHGVLSALTNVMEAGQLNPVAQAQCARGLETLLGLAALAVEAMPR